MGSSCCCSCFAHCPQIPQAVGLSAGGSHCLASMILSQCCGSTFHLASGHHSVECLHQVPPVANQFGMVKFTVSKGITKTSKAICHLLSSVITFPYAAGGQRPRSLHAHSSRLKKTIQIVTEPFLPHDHQHLMGQTSCPAGFSLVNFHHSRNYLLHMQIKFMV